MTAPDRRRITTRTLENAGAFPSDACGARHPPGTAPTARASRNQPSAAARGVSGRLGTALQAPCHAAERRQRGDGDRRVAPETPQPGVVEGVRRVLAREPRVPEDPLDAQALAGAGEQSHAVV